MTSGEAEETIESEQSFNARFLGELRNRNSEVEYRRRLRERLFPSPEQPRDDAGRFVTADDPEIPAEEQSAEPEPSFTARLRAQSQRGSDAQRQRLFPETKPLRDATGRFVSEEPQVPSMDGGVRGQAPRPTEEQQVRQAINTLIEHRGPFKRDPFAAPFAGVDLRND